MAREEGAWGWGGEGGGAADIGEATVAGTHLLLSLVGVGGDRGGATAPSPPGRAGMAQGQLGVVGGGEEELDLTLELGGQAAVAHHLREDDVRLRDDVLQARLLHTERGQPEPSHAPTPPRERGQPEPSLAPPHLEKGASLSPALPHPHPPSAS